MAAETPIYDLVVLLDADAPSERRAEILKEVEAAIGRGGEIVSKHDWGVRNLAYEIAHHKEAEYHLYQLTASTDLLERLRNGLRVTDGVLRHRIFRLPPGMPPPPALRPEPRAAEAPAPPAEAPPAEAPAPTADAPAAETAPAAEAPAAEAPPAAEPAAAEAPAEPADAPPAEAPSAS